MRVDIERPIDEYTRETYQFNVFDLNAVFVGYVVETKPKRAKKWKVDGLWDKYRDRDSSLEEPKLPQGIIDEVIETITSKICVLTWAEWKSK
jgi:hypothetical protein